MSNLRRKLYDFLVDKSGYLLFLFQELPGVGIWVGVMSLPFILYLVIFFASLPTSLINAVTVFITINTFYLERIWLLSGAVLFTYATYYLSKRKKEGLITTGPYKYIRHPQYFGILLMTIGLGSWSYVVYATTFGVTFWQTYFGWFFDPIKVWYIEFALYILIALIEEVHLSNKFGEAYKNYQKSTPFLIPVAFLCKNKFADLAAAIIVFITLFHLTVSLSLFLFLVQCMK